MWFAQLHRVPPCDSMLLQGFLTSVLQGYSRKEMIPVDQLSFEFVMQDSKVPIP